MKFIALVSGGKDSIYAILKALENGHTLLGCLHMAKPSPTKNGDEDEEEEESYMYQTAASSVVPTLVEECLQVPLILYQRTGKSIHTGLVYNSSSNDHNNNDDDNNPQPHDEVEDLFCALQQAKQQFPDMEGVCSGAILSTYQRLRIESVCHRLGLQSLSYLWRLAPQTQLLPQMLNDGIDALIVKTACPPGLMPRKHLQQPLRQLWDNGYLERLHRQYQFHVCGEGGEYESLVLDSPLHLKKLVLDDVAVMLDQNDDGVGELHIRTCHAQEKDDHDDVPISSTLRERMAIRPQRQPIQPGTSATSVPPTNKLITDKGADTTAIPNVTRHRRPTTVYYPNVHFGKGGLLHVSEIMTVIPATTTSSTNPTTEADLAVQEAIQVFETLQSTLRIYHATPQDVVFVHLYLSEMSHFANINAHYQECFGSLLPPSRSCVAVGRNVLPGGRRVLLDCMVQLGSGEYLRPSPAPHHGSNNKNDDGKKTVMVSSYAAAAHVNSSSQLRQVLHVQSISQWAPVCVGPYSQTNTIRSGLQFLAGQIGLIPATMTLQNTWEGQLHQCWTNIAAVLDALEGASIQQNVCGSVVYVATSVHGDEAVMMETIRSITMTSVATNGNIEPGRIDGIEASSSSTSTSELHGGYEDEGTWEEMKKSLGIEDHIGSSTAPTLPCPMLVVVIPEMPKRAVVEVEVIASTVDAAKCLERKDGYSKCMASSNLSNKPLSMAANWDTGHDFSVTTNVNDKIQLEAFSHCIGHGCAAIVVVTASFPIPNQDKPTNPVYPEGLFREMMKTAEKSLCDARSGLNHHDHIIHVRLFCVSAERDSKVERFHATNDGTGLRGALQAVLASSRVQQNNNNNNNNNDDDNPPASTVVPVQAIDCIYDSDEPRSSDRIIKYAMQVLVLDSVHMETEIWINKDRQYAI